ncbi:MAG TPA: TetR/AcrR family transcriptional regulator, partial [Ornithinibacter sp.]|nr:TetR/AcrR family transcriptional regulator [Ornithinibacter sp.]
MSRPPLSTQRVIQAASRVADDAGLAGVIMRCVCRAIGVEAMSLYHHVAIKYALLDGLADWVFDQIDTTSTSG